MRARRVELTADIAALTAAWAGARTFCQPAFTRLWCCRGGRPVAWFVERGGEPAAILPGVEFGRWPYVRFQSMPDGGYGGVLWPPSDDTDRAAVANVLLGAVARAGYAKVFVFDFYGSLPDCDGFQRGSAATTVVEIPGPQWQPPDRKLLAQVRKAEREGISVMRFDWARHARGFLELVRSTERRHGRRRSFYGEAFYRDLADLAATDDRVRWLMCEHGGRPACSHIYLLEQGTLQGWQIVFDKAFSFLKPNQYMRLWMCRQMAAAGIRRLNLGGSPENAPGLQAFKGRWGGTPIVYPVWQRRSGLGRLR